MGTRHKLLVFAVCALSALCAAGCATSSGSRAGAGVTYYCPGAGNYDFGDVGIRSGLRRAGYEGEVVPFYWTCSFNAAIDQIVRANPRQRARVLADDIMAFIDRNPGTPVNLIGLSAGSGVVIWALENLRPGYHVDEVILLSSSLSSDYDVRAALERVRGHIFVYYSDRDVVLRGPMKLVGTIDGVPGAEAAGRIGLHGPGSSERVINLRWQPEWKKHGHHGGHTDATNAAFAAAELSQRLLGVDFNPDPPSAAPKPAFASHRGAAPPDGDPR